jgi:NAD-dependent deacetylase
VGPIPAPARGVLQAAPNPAHLSLAALEQHLGDRFLLVTQDVDGLHLRAGSSLERTYQIHGNIHFARCLAECGGVPSPLPDGIPTTWAKERASHPWERELPRTTDHGCAQAYGLSRGGTIRDRV